MSCKDTGNRRYTWCPEDRRGEEHLVLSKWLKETMGEAAGGWWLREIDRLTDRGALLGNDNLKRLVRQICKHDCPELVELLYPRWPELFLQPGGRDGWNAVDLCAYLGSDAALWTLLELGADPNGLERMGSRHFTHCDQDERRTMFTLTPMDFARIAGRENCQLLLGMYGGVTAEELLQIPGEELPHLVYITGVGEYILPPVCTLLAPPEPPEDWRELAAGAVPPLSDPIRDLWDAF